MRSGDVLAGQLLAEKTVLVTGGGRGIGRTTAERFAERGAKVAVCARTIAEIDAVASSIRGAGGDAVAIALDVTVDDSVTEAIDRISELWGRVDVLVNCAGIASSAPVLKMPREMWDRILDVNLTGALRLTQAVLGPMLGRKWGRIIHVASIASKVGQKYVSAYCASKHGLLGFVRSVALEIATTGVTINAICPGYVDTPMTDDNVARIAAMTSHDPSSIRHMIERFSPQERLIQTDEVACLATYLASDAARGIHGQGINVCGGTVMW